MTDRITKEVKRETGSGTDLLHVIAAPLVWALHFLFCYVYVAIFCEKAGRAAPLDDARTAVVVATVIALVLIGWSTVSLWRVRGRSLTDDDFEFEHNAPEERHRFLSHVALMLCLLSAVAVVYVAIPIFYLATCR
jgi:heme/copper-type cytochrome/quinol oxidase subunit 2